MTKVVVADTGPLIALTLVELLPVLPGLFSRIYLPPAVVAEATQDNAKPGARAILEAMENGWITVPDVALPPEFQLLLDYLDRGEAETLALAKQLDAVALVNERRGRRAAARHGITVTGSAAVLLKAKQSGAIRQVKPLLERLGQCGYRMSDALTAEIIRRAGETP